MQTVTVRDAAKLFLEGIAGDVAPATLRLYRLYVDRFAELHGDVHLVDVTPAIVRAWGKTYHPVQAVQRLMSWCHREARLIPTNPIEGMRKMSRGRRLRTVAPVDLVRLQRRSTSAFRYLVLALAESFARPHELRNVRWNQVCVAGLRPADEASIAAGRAFFFLDRFKGQARRSDSAAVRVIPISCRLGRLLVRLRRRNQDLDSYVFTNSRRSPWTVNAVRLSFRRLRRRAGLVADHRGENVVAYSLRHTAATAAVVAGVPIAEIAGAMGHSDIRMTNRYVHLSPSFLRSVLERLEEAKRELRRKNRRPGSRRIDPNDAR